jgi:organic radical activating enzyme
MTDICNFRCGYCYRSPYKKNPYEPTINDIDNMINNLKSDNFKIIDFKIIGGEPCINNKTLYLVDKLTNELNINNIIIASNGSNRKFFEELKSRNLPNIILHLSYHPQYDNIINNFDWFINNFNDVYISCLLDKRYKDKVINFIDRYRNYEKILYIKMINNPEMVGDALLNTEFSDMKFLKDIAKYLKYKISDFILSHSVKDIYKNKLCYNNVLKIEPNGDLSYSGCHHIFPINYNIYSTQYIHQYYPIICNKDRMYGDCSNCAVNYHE